MKNLFIPFLQVLVIFAMIATARAADPKISTIIPEGEIVQEKEREVKVKTKAGSIVEVEFDRGGKFEEASGKAPDKDVLNPGNNLITLAKAYEALKAAGKTATGDWSLEKSFMKGWIYEFEGFENGKEVDYLINAENGKFLETRIDD